MQVAEKDLNSIPLLHKAESDLEMKRKEIFEALLQGIEDRWTAARYWILKLLSKDIDALTLFFSCVNRYVQGNGKDLD